MTSTRPPTRGWRRPRTSSRSATASIATLMKHREGQQTAHDDRDPDHLPGVEHFGQQKKRPHDRKRGLSDLSDPDRPDLDRLLRVDEEALGGDPTGKGQD